MRVLFTFGRYFGICLSLTKWWSPGRKGQMIILSSASSSSRVHNSQLRLYISLPLNFTVRKNLPPITSESVERKFLSLYLKMLGQASFALELNYHEVAFFSVIVVYLLFRFVSLWEKQIIYSSVSVSCQIFLKWTHSVYDLDVHYDNTPMHFNPLLLGNPEMVT